MAQITTLEVCFRPSVYASLHRMKSLWGQGNKPFRSPCIPSGPFYGYLHPRISCSNSPDTNFRTRTVLFPTFILWKADHALFVRTFRPESGQKVRCLQEVWMGLHIQMGVSTHMSVRKKIGWARDMASHSKEPENFKLDPGLLGCYEGVFAKLEL